MNNDRRITYWNAGAEHITGYTAAEVVGHSCAEGILRHVTKSGTQLCLQGCPLAAVMKDGKRRQAEVYLHHKDGHRVPVTVRGQPFYDESGQIVGSVEIFTPRVVSPWALTSQLNDAGDGLDPVTLLPTRRAGERQLDSLLEAFRSGENRSLGLLFCDLDHFKAVNDTFGHSVGDAVLRMAAQSLVNALSRGGFPVRWGGEELIALLPNATAEQTLATAERVRMLVDHSWLQVDDEQARVTVSIGATLAHLDESTVQLIDRADGLMYRSKRAGRNRVTGDEGTLTVTAERPIRGNAIPWEMPEYLSATAVDL